MSDETKEDLQKQLLACKKEIQQLHHQYQGRIGALESELSFVQEQLMAQRNMLKDAIDSKQHSVRQSGTSASA